MILKVNHDDLNVVTDNMLKNSDALTVEIDNLLDYLESIKLIWRGQDSDTFYDNAYNYINRMKIIPAAIDTFGKFIKEVDGQYVDSDNSFAKDLQKEKHNMFSNKKNKNGGGSVK